MTPPFTRSHLDMPSRTISIRGARTHNLKNVSVDIPQRQLTVLTGPSGSGKSSLAFNTLYAEGQRRFVESMSTYVRQFLERIDRPDVDEIDGILPAIAIEQKNSVKNARSTVATATELADHIRLFMTYCGETICPDCQVTVRQGDAGVDHERDRRRRWTASASSSSRRSSSRRKTAAKCSTQLDQGRLLPRLDRRRGARPQRDRHERRHLAGAGHQSAARRSGAQRADHRGDRAGVRDLEGERERARGCATATGSRHRFTSRFACNKCGTEFVEPTPHLFSFNSPLGACTNCQGYGRIIGIDMEKVIPNRDLRLDEMPIAPWNSAGYEDCYDDLEKAAEKYRLRLDVPIKDLTPEEWDAALQRPQQVVRHQRLLRVAGDEEVQDPRAGEAGEVPQLRAVPAVPRLAAEDRRRRT